MTHGGIGGSGFRFGDTGYSRVGTPRHPHYIQPVPVRQAPKLNVVPEHIQTAAKVGTAAPRIPWDEFVRDHFHWQRGEHVGLIGPTGQGKTTLMFNLYPLHPYTVVFGTKPRDENMDEFVNAGFVRLERWRSQDPRETPRRVLWPQPRNLREMVPYQRDVFTDAIEKIFREGHWDIFIDEGYYIDEVLKLGALLRLLYTQVRSMGISLVLGTQRPAWVPVEVYDQSTHLFFWRDNDGRNLRRLTEVSVIHSESIKEIIPRLEMHQVLYMNTRTGFMCRTRCPKIEFQTAS